MSEKIQRKSITELLGIKYPIIVAPMFLVSNADMVIAALRAGCTAAIPALNYRTQDELRRAIKHIRSTEKGPIGINLIVNKSNVRLAKDLDVCIEEGIDYYITSLGSPKEVIRRAHEKGSLVFCDVVNAEYAIKVQELGADAVIAVNNSAGGHAGPKDMRTLLTELKGQVSIPIISAGGVGDSSDLKAAMDMGASGVSVGSIFIASLEAPVGEDYKDAIVQYGKEDIVMTTRLSGTPCTVIKTPYVEKQGLEPTFLERLMKTKQLKKLVKMILFVRGMKKLRKAAYDFTYQKVWCAGPSIEKVQSIRPMADIISDLVSQIES
ncbi:MAG: nitronate monooxygenase [Vicingaceae bacterium]